MNRCRIARTVVALPVLVSLPFAATGARAGGFHQGTTETTRSVTRTAGHHHSRAWVSATPIAALPVSPASLMAYPAAPAPAAYSVSYQAAPAGSPGLTGTMGVGDGSEESDRQILAIGFQLHRELGDRSYLVGRMEDVLRKRLGELIRQGQSNQALRAALLETACGFLQSVPFGIVIDAAFEPILKRIVDRIVARHGGGGRPDDGPRPAADPRPAPIPAGGGIFDVSGVVNGRIVLTPVPASGAGASGNPGTTVTPPAEIQPAEPPTRLRPADGDKVPVDPQTPASKQATGPTAGGDSSWINQGGVAAPRPRRL